MNSQFTTVLFDFDGTVFDTVEGITKSIQYAIRKHGMDAELVKLRCFAGPPLVDKFMEVYGVSEEEAEQLVENSNLIILAGGHVPTQNAFFQKIHLKDLLKDYDGILIGISAGSMNCAKTVYAQPEETGEAVDPSYEKFIEGLGITETMILPHYQSVKDDLLDGMRLFEDITYGDSYGHVFYAIPDGTYLYIEEDKEELRGEAYRIKDGKMEIFCKENETVRMR